MGNRIDIETMIEPGHGILAHTAYAQMPHTVKNICWGICVRRNWCKKQKSSKFSYTRKFEINRAHWHEKGN